MREGGGEEREGGRGSEKEGEGARRRERERRGREGTIFLLSISNSKPAGQFLQTVAIISLILSSNTCSGCYYITYVTFIQVVILPTVWPS